MHMLVSMAEGNICKLQIWVTCSLTFVAFLGLTFGLLEWKSRMLVWAWLLQFQMAAPNATYPANFASLVVIYDLHMT